MAPRTRPWPRAQFALFGLSSFLLIVGSPTSGLAQRPGPGVQRLDLSGDWRYLPHNGEASFAGSAVADSAWPVMRLPSNWFLLGSNQYPQNADRGAAKSGSPGELWPVDKEAGLDWGGTVWFRRSFDWKPALGARTILDLDMVDYIAEVFVNGKRAGRHEGYSQKWSLDVTPHLRNGSNSIALRISAPTLPFDMSAHYPISWPKQQNQVKGIFLYHDTRPGATSARGQERSTGGVIRGIQVRESRGLDLVGVNVTSRDVSERSATLVVETIVRNWTQAPIAGALAGVVTSKNFHSWNKLPVKLAVNAPPGESRFRTEVRIDKPALWWSWDFGKPNLYKLEATLARSDSVVADRATTVFGVRSISVDSAWVWRLNGKRIYPRGTNYISTQWLSQADRRWYARDVDLMLAANLNTVRVHAHLERPEFYEVADSAGIMVWQDFPLQWGYTDDPSFHAEALRQTRDMIDRFASHPSIIVWAMHNESPHAMSWMQKKDPEQNLALDNALTALAKSLDPSRVHHRDSGTGDGHPYPGWYGGKVGDYAKLPKEPFITEYGAQALPSLETLRTMLPDSAVWPREEGHWERWAFHNFQAPQTFDIAKIPKGLTIEDFVANSQLYQAQVMRFATEIYRRAKWKGNTGIYQFMFVEDWPSITWAVLDYYRRAKPGFAALRSSMQPVLPSIEYQIDDRDKPLSLHVVNDLHRGFPGAALKWRVVAPGVADGPVNTHTLDIGADVAVKVVELGLLPNVARGAARLEAWIEDREGRLLGKTVLSAEDFR